jgi:hypothetical protein
LLRRTRERPFRKKWRTCSEHLASFLKGDIVQEPDQIDNVFRLDASMWISAGYIIYSDPQGWRDHPKKADLATVQKLMGHANANTTAGYDRRGEQAKRSAVKKLHVLYQRRSQAIDPRTFR